MDTISSEELEESVEVDELMKKYNDFVKKMSADNPIYQLWSSYLEMVLLLLTFIRVTREPDWELHVAVLWLMMAWYFAYGRTNYARYLPVYWLEMISLPTTRPLCYEEMSICGG